MRFSSVQRKYKPWAGLKSSLLLLFLLRDVSPERRGEKPAHLLLVLFVLGVFTGRDPFCKHSRPLEEKYQGTSTEEHPVVRCVGGGAAPLVEHKPNSLLRKKVGMPAVSP